MSSYIEGADKKTVAVMVNAPPGVEISITRGPFEDVAKGFGSIVQNLAEGIYTVRWHSAGKISQRAIRLKAGQTAVQLDYDRSDDIDRATKLYDAFVTSSNIFDRPPGVILIAQYPNGEKPGHISADINLRYAGSGTNGASKTVLDLAPSTRGIGFDIGAGSHVLRYKSVDHLSMEQALDVYPGRTTIVLAPLARVSRPVKVKNESRFRSRLGVDPAKIVMFTVPFDAGAEYIENAVRLASTLLEMLSRGFTSLDPKLSKAALECGDPFVSMYAAAILLASISANETFRLTLIHTLEEDEVAQAQLLLAAQVTESSDSQCARWRLALDGWVENGNVFSDLSAPPMLERSWQWASVWSVTNPGRATVGRDVSAASLSRVATAPWLVWRGNARVSSVPQVDELLDGLEELARRFTATVNKVREGVMSARDAYAPPKAVEFPGFDVSQLSADTKNLAMSAVRLAAETGPSTDLGVLKGLASALKTPINMVAGQMRQALKEVERAKKASDDYGQIFGSDPNKGLFGGISEVNGYKLFLRSWDQSNDPEFLVLELVVIALRRPAPTRAVKFHLHPTFNPSIEAVRWRKSEAVCRCYAMGGFTLGVETGDGTRLELDLAMDQRLPSWFRSR